jgi:hypothetical protein
VPAAVQRQNSHAVLRSAETTVRWPSDPDAGVTPDGTGTGWPFHFVLPRGAQLGWPTFTPATGSPGCAKKIGLEYLGLSGVPESFIVKPDERANWLAYGLLEPMLCGAAGTFHGLD